MAASKLLCGKIALIGNHCGTPTDAAGEVMAAFDGDCEGGCTFDLSSELRGNRGST